jgi:hypothetical protein
MATASDGMVPLIPGTVALPVQWIDPQTLCAAAGPALDRLVDEEQLLWVLEAAVAQLHGVVEELRLVGAGTRGMSESIHSLSAVDWRSPAGEAFLERSQRLRARATELAETAEDSVTLARAAIGELHWQIGELRSTIASAKAAAVGAATLGVC